MIRTLMKKMIFTGLLLLPAAMLTAQPGIPEWDESL
jgi:hypothetical protein